MRLRSARSVGILSERSSMSCGRPSTTRRADASMVTGNAWGIAAAIVMWVAGLTGILVATAPGETRVLWRWPTRPRRRLDLRRSFAALAGSDGDVVDSRQIRDAPASASRRDPFEQRQRVGLESDRPSAPADAGLLGRVRLGGAMTATNAPQQAIDPLAEKAATLLAKAMFRSRNRDLLWQRFYELVVATATELEEAPVRDAIEEIERRGLSLDVVARVVQQRLSE